MLHLSPLDYPQQKRAELLDKTRWANNFSWEQIVKLSAYTQVFLAKQGRALFEEGSHEQILGIIIQGRLNIIKKDDHYKSRVITSLNSSQSFGEISFIDGQQASASVIADMDTQLLILTRQKFDELATSNSKLAFKLLMIIAQMLCEKLRNTSGKLVDCMDDS